MSSAIAVFAESPKEEFQKVSDAYFDQVYYPNQPSSGTTAGYHQYDSKLEDFSQVRINAEVAALNDFDKRVSAIAAASLDQTTRGDRQMVLGQLDVKRPVIVKPQPLDQELVEELLRIAAELRRSRNDALGYLRSDEGVVRHGRERSALTR